MAKRRVGLLHALDELHDNRDHCEADGLFPFLPVETLKIRWKIKLYNSPFWPRWKPLIIERR